MFANNGRNLHLLMSQTGFSDVFDVTPHKPANVKENKMKIGAKIALPKNLLMPVASTRQAPQFSRAVDFRSTDFCDLVNDALQEKSLNWTKSQLFKGDDECLGQLTDVTQYDGSPHNSLFIQIRKSQREGVDGFRMKLVLAPEDDCKDYRTQFETIIIDLIKQKKWDDFDGEFEKSAI